MANNHLNRAKEIINDEYYTRMIDIEMEMKNYIHHFKDKIVYNNCDDPRWSNFFIYFKDNFIKLGLKKLIATFFTDDKTSFKRECSLENGEIVCKDTKLIGDGGFGSRECLSVLKQSDIIVTNPPFSIAREFFNALNFYRKKYLFICSNLFCTNSKVFPYFKRNETWLGFNDIKLFEKPDGTIGKVAALWYTNLTPIKPKFLKNLYQGDLFIKHAKYDNYDAIEVNSMKSFPVEYEGKIGVPVTFIQNFNPNHYEILECLNGLTIGDKKFFKRFIVQKRKDIKKEN